MTKKKSIKCTSCSAPLNIEPNKEITICTYCNSKYSTSELLNETETIRIEKLKNKKATIEAEKQKEVQEQRRIEKENQELELFKKSLFNKVLLLLIGASIITSIALLSIRISISAIIAIIQTVLLLVVWLSGMQILPKETRKIKSLLVLMAAILVIPFIFFLEASIATVIKWENVKVNEYIPEPPTNIGIVSSNEKDYYLTDYYNITQEKFYEYVNELKEEGYTIITDDSDWFFEAYNSEGNQIHLFFESEYRRMSLRFEIPEKLSEIIWPDTKLVSTIPLPESNIGIIHVSEENYFDAIIGQTTEKEFEEYVVKCKNEGFIYNKRESENSYHATNKEGYKISIYYEANNRMEINLSNILEE